MNGKPYEGMNGRHVNIPIFIPHKGCPHDCIFCNQKKISGETGEISPEQVREIIESHLATIEPGAFIEVAFFGGSFTAIEKRKQQAYLEAAYEFVQNGRAKQIRLSTRPDHIDEGILLLLQKYGVKTIELGVQSLDDEVLKLSGRGHDADAVYRSSRLIRDFGFHLGIQTMIGLPGDTREKAVETANKVAGLSPSFVRIYPALVIRDTGLEKMLQSGQYTPLTLEEATETCAELLKIYRRKQIPVIRVGLQASENINSSGDVISGPFHPAFRQLVESRLAFESVIHCIEVQSLENVDKIRITTGISHVSNVVGNRKSNLEKLKRIYGFKEIKVTGSPHMSDEVRIDKL